MTRGLYPPDTLTKDDVQTLANVRKEIYTGGLLGGGESSTLSVLSFILL